MITRKVPTGHICIAEGEKGPLEFLSIGDYGKEKNIKADFLGHMEEIHGVPSGDTMPLEDKWVITLSSQYGCSMRCKFCDVPRVGPGINATYRDLDNQLERAVGLHPEVISTNRLNIHYARMGEPTFNSAVLNHAQHLSYHTPGHLKWAKIHPVLSTMLPRRNSNLLTYLNRWMLIKNVWHNGNAGLQFSINSTSDEQRDYLFGGKSWGLETISHIGTLLPNPKGRKIALNFAITKDSEVDGQKLYKLFSPDKFMVKITPIHETKAAGEWGLETTGGYDEYSPYVKIEEECKRAGFDTLVFIPSIDEDKSKITCGNAILAEREGDD